MTKLLRDGNFAQVMNEEKCQLVNIPKMWTEITIRENVHSNIAKMWKLRIINVILATLQKFGNKLEKNLV